MAKARWCEALVQAQDALQRISEVQSAQLAEATALRAQSAAPTSSRTIPVAVPTMPLGTPPSLFASIMRVFVMSKGNVADSAMQAAVALRQYVVPKDRPDLSGPPICWLLR